jgi:cation diffusion facilitator CzcD-associated flavoprotein CzcO
MSGPRCCIIGAGPAGLFAARALRGVGLAYDQIERNPDVGGIWHIRNAWSPTPALGLSSPDRAYPPDPLARR